MKTRDDIQREALTAWLQAHKKGTCEIITGLGKTFISLHALITMPKDKTHLFLAETTSREEDLKRDIAKYKKIFNIDIVKDYKLEFYCYQTAYKWKQKDFGLVIADEIHDSMTPAYSEFFQNNKYDAIIGLSATIERNTEYVDPDTGITFNKGELIDLIAPVVYKYGLDDGQRHGTARKLNINVISHKLDDTTRNVLSGSKSNPFYQTEKAAYEYWDKEFKKAVYVQDNEIRKWRITFASQKRSRILYNMKSKVPVVKKLISELEKKKSKTILFGNSLDSLLSVTTNVVSSRNTEDQNKAIREAFESGDTLTIGSFKKLKQGANLEGLDNCIIMSYYSTEKDLIQRLGRLRNNGLVGNVYIILTMGTKEEDWFSKMFENIDNFDVKYFINIDHLLKTK